MADVRGQHDAVEALTVAGAGGHHVFLLGEPGSGKTMLASRMHTILPDLDDDTALVATSLHSLAGTLRDGEALVRRPPILTPHHSATMAALVGGGHARITPGAASLAHGGVLFLDEAAQFQPSVLDALREPLENGEVHIHRAGLHARLPARFQLLLAANPCPCGGGRQGRSCTCSAQARMRYLARLSGPLLDRIDITVRVDTPTRADLARGPSPSSARLRERVAEARSRCARRLAGTPWTLNAQVPGRWIRASSGIDPRMVADLDRAVESGVFSMRGADRVLRLMWTTADLNGAARPGEVERGLAIWLRKGDNPND